jgi:hypothetical protein
MRQPLRVVWIVWVLALCPSPATGEAGQREAKSRFQGYNQYALDTLRIVNTFGQYAMKTGDWEKQERFRRLRDEFVSAGTEAQELLEREAESTIAPNELERQWEDLIRKCIAFRKEIDPSLVTWVSNSNKPGDSSSDDWRLIVGTQPEIPDDVLVEIRRQAGRDHPGDELAQRRVVERQTKAYRQWRAYDCMRAAPFHVYQFIRDQAARDHPGDYATQLQLLDGQMEAYDQLQQYEAPLQVPVSDLHRIKEKAALKQPYDFSTQLFTVKRNVDKYIELKMRGASGDAILRYLLRE